MARKYLALGALTLALLTFSLPSHALTCGQVGEPYEVKGKTWQKVHLDHQEIHVKASIPGSPSSGMSGPWLFSESTYNDEFYRILASMNPYQTPASYPTFVKELTKMLPTGCKIVPKNTKLKACYSASFKAFEKGNLVMNGWAIATKTRLYVLLSEGSDHSLDEAFFEGFQL